MAQQDHGEKSVESKDAGEDPSPLAGSLPRILTSEINMGHLPETVSVETTMASELPLNTAVSASVAAADATDIESRTGQVLTSDDGITLMPTRANPVARRLLAKMWISEGTVIPSSFPNLKAVKKEIS